MYNNELEPRLEEAVAGTRAVYFVDASHFVLAPFLGFLWGVARVFLRAGYPLGVGRQRFNVLGALQAVTHQLLTVTNDTYITAESVRPLLEKIAAAIGGRCRSRWSWTTRATSAAPAWPPAPPAWWSSCCSSRPTPRT